MDAVQEQDVDTLANLEQRITRAVELLTTLRGENDQLQQRLKAAQEEFESVKSQRDEAQALSAEFQKENGELEQKVKQLSQELDDLRGERKQVKARIEKLLGQMDLLSAT